MRNTRNTFSKILKHSVSLHFDLKLNNQLIHYAMFENFHMYLQNKVSHFLIPSVIPRQQ